MPDYTYGPWTVHTSGERPVPDDTLVQVQLRNQSQISAEVTAICTAVEWNWSDTCYDAITYYRIARKAEWLATTGRVNAEGAYIYSVMASDAAREALGIKEQFRVHWPVIDGQPDFTRQPKWEKV